MDNINIISITHEEDVDGIGCQAIIYRYIMQNNDNFEILKNLIVIKPDYKVNLVNLRTDYYNYLMYWAAIFAKNMDKLPKKIQDIIPEGINRENFEGLLEFFYKDLTGSKIVNIALKSVLLEKESMFEDASLIIISDIGFNQNFRGMLDYFVDSQFKVAYFDHHEQDEDVKNILKKFCIAYVIDGIQTASEIVRDFFLPADDIAFKISEFGADADFNRFKLPDTSKFQSILNRKLNYNVLNLIVEKFAEGNFSDPLIEKLYEESRLWQSEQDVYLKDHTYAIYKEETPIGALNFVMGACEMKSERITRSLQKNYKGTDESFEQDYVYIGLNINTGEVNLRSHTVNMKIIAKEFGGGGHPERAGFTIPEKYLKSIPPAQIEPETVNFQGLIDDITLLLSNIEK